MQQRTKLGPQLAISTNNILSGVDECQDPSNCKNGHCVDTPGSYYCICSPPWTLATDRNSCVTPEEQAGEWSPTPRK